MLPSSKSSLLEGGFSPKAAAWTLIACFIAGAAGIQLISRIVHRYIPSHVVDCHHTHEDDESFDTSKHDHHTHVHGNPRHELKGHRHHSRSHSHLSANGDIMHHRRPSSSAAHHSQHTDRSAPPQRPLLHSNFSSKVSQLVLSQKAYCDENGQCYGYTDPCGIDCFRNIQARGGSKLQYYAVARHPALHRSSTLPQQRKAPPTESTPLLVQVDEEDDAALSGQPSAPADLNHTSSSTLTNGSPASPPHTAPSHAHSHDETEPAEHHHHVPTNAFLSIGLQTCLAIALHKLPEGFITYATNHANPRLGFSVFLALFIHNITEGFAMALPLYLALQSRGKAIIWAFILGGVSQPLGAAVAALWFHLAGNSESWGEPGEGVYGCLFAIVAGILASVALQLFSESLDLTHNRNLCMAFAFVGMGILGVSGALTA